MMCGWRVLSGSILELQEDSQQSLLTLVSRVHARSTPGHSSGSRCHVSSSWVSPSFLTLGTSIRRAQVLRASHFRDDPGGGKCQSPPDSGGLIDGICPGKGELLDKKWLKNKQGWGVKISLRESLLHSTRCVWEERRTLGFRRINKDEQMACQG